MFLSGMMSSCQLFQPHLSNYEVNKVAYDKADTGKTRILVSIFDQQAWLLDGEGKVLVRTGVSTGVPGHDTPVGDFSVLEKLKNKRSNKYGRYVDIETGKVIVPKTWLHEGSIPAGTKYQGIEMPFWLRITWDGVGMHVGKFPRRTRCSFGCIRAHKEAQPLIYAMTRVGTPVTIVSESKLAELGAGKYLAIGN
ncbi:MAG: L,D-transpeptidase family protein [Akkermansiaceae bacterium]